MYPSRLDYIVDKPPVRRPRRDAILRRLPDHQRALVHKWLFDKALTYAQVAQACFDTFQLEISKSSVARYYHTEMAARLRQKAAGRKPASPSPDYANLTSDQRYKLLEDRIMELAYLEANLPQALIDQPRLIRLVRLCLAFRRERNERERLRLFKLKHQLRLAKLALRYRRDQEDLERREKAELDNMNWLPGPKPGTWVPFTWPANAGIYGLGHHHPIEVALRRERGLPDT